jgi:type IV pilus assembly protein PilQ
MKQQAKCKDYSTELLFDSMKRRNKGVKLSALCSMLCALFLMLFSASGCATAKSSAKEPLKPEAYAVITGIDIQDNSMTITADKPFIFTIYKPGDPYKIVVDLPDVRLGAFTARITSHKSGITEVVPSQTESSAPMARLEVLLQNPSSVEQDYKNNILTIKIKGDAAEKQEPRASEPLSSGKRELLAQKEGNPYQAPGAAESKTAAKATEISDIAFETYGNTVKVLIKGNGAMVPNVFPLDGRIVIDISGVVMNTTVPSSVVSPVKALRAGTHDDMVRLVFDLKEKTNFDVAAIGNSIVITLKDTEGGSAQFTPEEETGEIPATKTAFAENPESFGQRGLDTPVNHRCESFRLGKENVNFDFQDQDIVPILRLFADISGCNIFIHPEVKGKATMKFRDVPWNQAFDTLLKTFNLGQSVEGNILRIAPLSVFARESDEKVKAQQALEKAEPLETKMFPVSYAKVSVVDAAIKNAKILSPRGSVSVDERTSSMLVKDISSVFPEIDNLLVTLDRPTPQVLIEARIVEVNTATTRDLGIQWGLTLKGSNTLSQFGGLSGVPNTQAGQFSGGNYLVDFPSKSVSPLSGSGFAFGIINPARTMALDLQLSAIETAGNGKVISNPKILTIDNGKAKILQGKSIPVRKLTSEGTVSTEFKDVTLELNVVPHITPDKSISMVVDIKKEELDPTVPSVEGVPGTDKKEANTNVIIKDGETVVIGGMYKITTNDSVSGVPGLMKVPLLGWLFKSDSVTSNTSELLIFITPRIVVNP